MTASKKPTPISRHKTGTTRQVASAKAASAPQAFDIIPRNQVKPSATSRPVITPSQPEVSDNTLTQPNVAPQLQLRHKTASLKPSAQAEADAEAAKAIVPETQGVTVAELLAKRAESDKPAAVETIAAVQDPPQPAVAPAVTTEPPKMTEAGEPKEQPNDQSKDETNAPSNATEPETKPEDKPADAEDSLAQALKDDAEAPQEHSESLKEAIKDLDGEPEAPKHHELFGGKPVIVVHKEHHTSGLMWFVWFIVCLVLAVIIVNFLLDAKVITTTYDVPYTDVLQ